MIPTAGFPRILAELADLAELRGASPTAQDLRGAAAAVAALRPAEIARLEQRAARRGLRDEPGIPPRIHGKLCEIASAPDDALHAARAGVPRLLRRLLDLRALTASEAVSLVRRTGVLTLGDLQTAIAARRHQRAPGALAERLEAAAEALALEVRPLTLGRATDLIEAVSNLIDAACPAIEALTPAGDIRRCEPLVSDVVLAGRAVDPPAAIDALAALPGLDDVLHRGPRRAILRMHQTEVDVRVAAPEAFGTTLFRATGTPSHVAAVEGRRPVVRLAAAEEEVYAHAGLQFVPAELRQGEDEIDRAAARTLPGLVRIEDIRGDLHMHSSYSDGHDTLEAMVSEARRLGYEYMAITDHSERCAASRTVTPAQLERQRGEVARLRERYPDLAILHGIEVDVMPDGRLDFPDVVLERLDLVIASLHDAAGHDGRRLTARAITAIRHPLVSILSHPANRVVGHRGDYPLDYPALYAAAAESGTALEIDGAPVHLDLDGARAREAAAAGATLVIDSDAHRVRGLGRQMRFGVGTARRGRLEARHVLNTRPLAEVRRFIAAKRGRA